MSAHKPTTHIVAILDESGSMAPLQQAVIESYNGYFETQRQEKGETRIRATLIKFAPPTVVFADRRLSEVPKLSKENYKPHSGTPLYDAIAFMVDQVQPRVKDGDRVLVWINTDGEENESVRMSQVLVKALIQGLEAGGNWTFIFAGAGIDAFEAAGGLGIKVGNTFQYQATPSSARAMGQTIGLSTAHYAASAAASSATFFEDAGQTQEIDSIGGIVDHIPGSKVTNKVLTPTP